MSENTYSSYLHLDQLLSAQDCATEADSELLFLTIHQAKELWFKLMIHELEGARRALYAGDAGASDPAGADPNLGRALDAVAHRVSGVSRKRGP